MPLRETDIFEAHRNTEVELNPCNDLVNTEPTVPPGHNSCEVLETITCVFTDSKNDLTVTTSAPDIFMGGSDSQV